MYLTTMSCIEVDAYVHVYTCPGRLQDLASVGADKLLQQFMVLQNTVNTDIMITNIVGNIMHMHVHMYCIATNSQS